MRLRQKVLAGLVALVILATVFSGIVAAGPKEFIAEVGPTAQEVCRDYGIYASVLIAQMALESGWGKSRPELARVHNYFGRKWKGTGSYVWVYSPEYLDEDFAPPPAQKDLYIRDRERGARWWLVMSKFRAFKSLREGMEEYAINITTSGRYTEALRHRGNREAYIDALAWVYATDPHYNQKIKVIIAMYDLGRFD